MPVLVLPARHTPTDAGRAPKASPVRARISRLCPTCAPLRQTGSRSPEAESCAEAGFLCRNAAPQSKIRRRRAFPGKNLPPYGFRLRSGRYFHRPAAVQRRLPGAGAPRVPIPEAHPSARHAPGSAASARKDTDGRGGTHASGLKPCPPHSAPQPLPRGFFSCKSRQYCKLFMNSVYFFSKK